MLDIRVGSWVGPFKVVAPLEEAARAGMATLFVAQLTRLERTQLVVLKIIPVEDEGYDERGALRLNALRKEVEILQKLRHPNIVKIYPIPSRNGRREHYIARAANVLGNPWFCAMEHLGGGSLESRLRELTVLPLGEAVEIACQIGSALDYMHTKGYVHWDVKPDNILFRYDLYQDGVVEAVLTDFGIARRTHEPGVVAGTVRYMSPERLRVHMGEIPPDRIMDQRPADVYALGLVLYEMLAGNLPFVAEDEESIKYAILEEPPIPLSDFNYEVPPVVEDIIFQALEKNPANRPTMEEMVTMLDRAVPAPRVIQPPSGPAAAPVLGAVGPGITGAAVVGRPAARARPVEVPERRERRPPLIQTLALIAAAAALVLVGGTWAAGKWGIIPTATPEPAVITATVAPIPTPADTPAPTLAPLPIVSDIIPNSASTDEGSITMTIVGENFQDLSEVWLISDIYGDIPATEARVSAGGRMRCSFDISDAEPGARSVLVSNPDGTVSELPNAFTIIAPPTPTATSTPTPTATPAATPTKTAIIVVPTTPVRQPPKITRFDPTETRHSSVEVTIYGQNLSQCSVWLIRTADGHTVSCNQIRASDSEILCRFDDLPMKSWDEEWKLRVEGPGAEFDEKGPFYTLGQDDDDGKKKKEGEGK